MAIARFVAAIIETFSRRPVRAVQRISAYNMKDPDAAMLGGLALLSVALLFWATGDGVLAAGFLAGVFVHCGLRVGRQVGRVQAGTVITSTDPHPAKRDAEIGTHKLPGGLASRAQGSTHPPPGLLRGSQLG